MPDRIADYQVVRVLDDPARPGMRFVARPPARLALGDRVVVIEVGPGEPADVLPDVSRWASAATPVHEPDAGGLVVPLEMGPLEGEGRAAIQGLYWATPAMWLSRLAGVDDTVTPDPVTVVGGAAAGLAALHRAGGVHGSVAAGRMLTTSRSGVLDLPPLQGRRLPGLVARVGSSGDLDGVAPEVAQGEAVSPASDVWALGACLHVALTGRRIHPGIDTDMLLTAVQRVVFEPPSVDAGDWSGLIGACCRTDPAQRPDAAEVAATLSPTRPATA